MVWISSVGQINMSKVIVAGFFDLFHAGHVKFLENCSKYGDVYVSIGSDGASLHQKDKLPIYTEEERLYIVKSCRFVKDAKISSMIHQLSSLEYIKEIEPDIFIVNEDGDSKEKRDIMMQHGIQYIVLPRDKPEYCTRSRSSTSIKKKLEQAD
jgi:cytidyltransferase-like protein